MAHLETRTSSELQAAIDHIAANLELAPSTARALVLEWRRFLRYADGGTEALRPSQAIDRCWHSILGDSDLYTAVCLSEFGRYVHHYRAEGTSVASARYARQAFESEGIHFDERFWPLVPASDPCWSGEAPPPPG